MRTVFAVHMPNWEIAEIPVEQALPLIADGKHLSDLLNYVPTETTKPLVFFLSRGAAEKFVELCKLNASATISA